MSMKVESGVATSTALQKIKVKEEKEECCNIQQKTETSSTSTSTAAKTITTLTITTDTNTALSTNNTATVTTLGSPSTLAIVTPSTTSVVQPTPLICQPPVLKSSLSIKNNTEPHPIDLDLKTKSKVISTAVSSSNEKSGTREENHSQSGGENRLHPPYQKTHQTSNGLRSDYKIGSRSSDNDSPLSSLPLKNDTDEGSFKLDETENTGEGNGVSNGGFKTISAIFSGHGKLKRLLGTLVQFAMDISLDTGDTVRSLVLGLMSGAMSAEEFHSALQNATNFPLRGFVLPYLKHTLPSLQKDLSSAARINNQKGEALLIRPASEVNICLSSTVCGGIDTALSDYSISSKHNLFSRLLFKTYLKSIKKGSTGVQNA